MYMVRIARKLASCYVELYVAGRRYDIYIQITENIQHTPIT